MKVVSTLLARPTTARRLLQGATGGPLLFLLKMFDLQQFVGVLVHLEPGFQHGAFLLVHAVRHEDHDSRPATGTSGVVDPGATEQSGSNTETYVEVLASSAPGEDRGGRGDAVVLDDVVDHAVHLVVGQSALLQKELQMHDRGGHSDDTENSPADHQVDRRLGSTHHREEEEQLGAGVEQDAVVVNHNKLEHPVEEQEAAQADLHDEEQGAGVDHDEDVASPPESTTQASPGFLQRRDGSCFWCSGGSSKKTTPRPPTPPASIKTNIPAAPPVLQPPPATTRTSTITIQRVAEPPPPFGQNLPLQQEPGFSGGNSRVHLPDGRVGRGAAPPGRDNMWAPPPGQQQRQPLQPPAAPEVMPRRRVGVGHVQQPRPAQQGLVPLPPDAVPARAPNPPPGDSSLAPARRDLQTVWSPPATPAWSTPLQRSFGAAADEGSRTRTDVATLSAPAPGNPPGGRRNIYAQVPEQPQRGRVDESQRRPPKAGPWLPAGGGMRSLSSRSPPQSASVAASRPAAARAPAAAAEVSSGANVRTPEQQLEAAETELREATAQLEEWEQTGRVGAHDPDYLISWVFEAADELKRLEETLGVQSCSPRRPGGFFPAGFARDFGGLGQAGFVGARTQLRAQLDRGCQKLANLSGQDYVYDEHKKLPKEAWDQAIEFESANWSGYGRPPSGKLTPGDTVVLQWRSFAPAVCCSLRTEKTCRVEKKIYNRSGGNTGSDGYKFDVVSVLIPPSEKEKYERIFPEEMDEAQCGSGPSGQLQSSDTPAHQAAYSTARARVGRTTGTGARQLQEPGLQVSPPADAAILRETLTTAPPSAAAGRPPAPTSATPEIRPRGQLGPFSPARSPSRGRAPAQVLSTSALGPPRPAPQERRRADTPAFSSTSGGDGGSAGRSRNAQHQQSRAPAPGRQQQQATMRTPAARAPVAAAAAVPEAGRTQEEQRLDAAETRLREATKQLEEYEKRPFDSESTRAMYLADQTSMVQGAVDDLKQLEETLNVHSCIPSSGGFFHEKFKEYFENRDLLPGQKTVGGPFAAGGQLDRGCRMLGKSIGQDYVYDSHKKLPKKAWDRAIEVEREKWKAYTDLRPPTGHRTRGDSVFVNWRSFDPAVCCSPRGETTCRVEKTIQIVNQHGVRNNNRPTFDVVSVLIPRSEKQEYERIKGKNLRAALTW
ncbi:unnamed protein product [Amoebophrya sp. A120]|nr:unnamed protein product [Amoebophrya sp. A120]|eukprot:GSA120T00017661001.1